ncbi:NADH-quinone oxidoreductase subunit E [Syntrophobacter sp. SbD1]|nr:NADH-quinone oxidoreductase subunit E [Syntrophobacter sp. SbD1]
MLPDELKLKLEKMISDAESPREKAIDVMFEIQELQGWMSDEAMVEAAGLLGMTPLELEELATFYDYIYRSPVGKYVIKVCDSTVCWLEGHQSIIDYISARAGVPMGGTSPDGLFTLLPVCCIGYCDRAPAMVINKRVYGKLTPEKIDRILDKLANSAEFHESE